MDDDFQAYFESENRNDSANLYPPSLGRRGSKFGLEKGAWVASDEFGFWVGSFGGIFRFRQGLVKFAKDKGAILLVFQLFGRQFIFIRFIFIIKLNSLPNKA